jgi:2',3'-cyclic-nucleotide 2'-phosphodiesterase (5'-nucleotidase family)
MLRSRFLWIISALSLLSACKTSSLKVADVKTQNNISINAEIKDEPTFTSFIEPYKKKLDLEMNQKISSTRVDLTKSGDNSNLGNLLADYTFDGADNWAKKNLNISIDAALINIGGIRTTIGKGDILLRNVYEVMPFENEVIIMKMKGADMQGLFDYYAKNEVNNPVSHLYIETENHQLTKSLISGKGVDPNKTYYIATSDYLALGGDNMKFFSKGEYIATGIKLRDLFIEYFKKNADINPNEEIRLNFIEKK